MTRFDWVLFTPSRIAYIMSNKEFINHSHYVWHCYFFIPVQYQSTSCRIPGNGYTALIPYLTSFFACAPVCRGDANAITNEWGGVYVSSSGISPVANEYELHLLFLCVYIYIWITGEIVRNDSLEPHEWRTPPPPPHHLRCARTFRSFINMRAHAFWPINMSWFILYYCVVHAVPGHRSRVALLTAVQFVRASTAKWLEACVCWQAAKVITRFYCTHSSTCECLRLLSLMWSGGAHFAHIRSL